MVANTFANMSADSELEIVCPSCAGVARFNDPESENGFTSCPRCDGSGFIPTDLGRKVLALVRHNSKVTSELRVFSAR